MDLRMARGDQALVLPELLAGKVRALAREVDVTIDRDRDHAAELSAQELDLYVKAEAEVGHRLHKGHALHNLAAAILPADPERARTHFHAAYIEDVRTALDVAEVRTTPARQTLQEMYSETPALLGRLESRARDSTTDPLELASAFETDETPLPSYRGFRRGSRKLESLDRFPRDRLIFVAGSHALPDRMLALRDAVLAERLVPVVVIEFEDFIANAYVKSDTLMERCGAVVFDVSFGAAGWDHELHIANRLGLPRFAGLVAWSTADAVHTDAMTKGFLDLIVVEPVATTTDEQLAAEARAWLRGQGSLRPALTPETEALTPIGAAGTAYYGPFSKTHNSREPFPEFQPTSAVPSGWSGPVDLLFDPTTDIAKLGLRDGKLIKIDKAADPGVTWVKLRDEAPESETTEPRSDLPKEPEP
jgi:hypothetical protein